MSAIRGTTIDKLICFCNAAQQTVGKSASAVSAAALTPAIESVADTTIKSELEKAKTKIFRRKSLLPQGDGRM